ncbi:MAG: polysaccharide deacetylase family protein [Alphaproteobacteria bacterium]
MTAELDLWGEAGVEATFWWRDDDATAPSPALDRLLALQRRYGTPLALAVVPRYPAPALAERLAAHDPAGARVVVLQHGYAHQNHAGEGEKAIELGAHRPAAHVVAELAVGRENLSAFPGALPILVPPWNRIAPHLLPLLPELGFSGLSTFGARASAEPVPGLGQTNTHIDPVDWRGSRGFLGAALDMAVTHLGSRRQGLVDAAEPTGLLTHHLDHDATTWEFIETLLAIATEHPAARWLGAGEAFGFGS